MRLKPIMGGWRVAKRRRLGFTLAEVLAALAFMAIVIPVAMEGMRIANRAGVVALRKSVALRVADRVLNELLLTGASEGSARSGVVQEGSQDYRWFVRYEPWREDVMRLATVQVIFPVQGEEYDVQLSTLLSAAP